MPKPDEPPKPDKQNEIKDPEGQKAKLLATVKRSREARQAEAKLKSDSPPPEPKKPWWKVWQR